MRKDVAKAWVAALRGGEYTQCFGYERWQPEDKLGRLERVRYDALGVLGDLVEESLGDVEIFKEYQWQQEEGIVAHIVNHEALEEFAGLNEGWAFGKGNDGEMIETVITMNDSGATFGEIATFVEKVMNLEKKDAEV